MSLTAARTELNIILAGADETARMLAESRENMRKLEERLRALTAATNAQAGAAGGAGTATAGFGASAAAAANAVDAQRERIDGVIGKVNEYIGLWGDIGDIISGATDAYNFIRERVSEVAQEEAKHKKILEEQKQAYDSIIESLAEIEKLKRESVIQARAANHELLTEQIRLAELEKKDELAASLRAKLEHQVELDRVTELEEQLQELHESKVANNQIISDAVYTLRENEAFVAEQRAKADALEIENKQKKLALDKLSGEYRPHVEAAMLNLTDEMEENEAQIRRLKEQIYEVTVKTINPEKERLNAATQVNTQFLIQKKTLNDMLDVAKKIANALKGGGDVLNMDVLDESKAADKPSRGGGGGGKSKAEREREAAERKRQQRMFLYELALEDEALEATRKRLQENADLGDKVLASYGAIRERIVGELASLPTDATSAAFEPLRNELKKQLEIIDKAAAGHRKMQASDLFFFDVDAINKTLDAFDAEAAGIAKVDQALQNLNETRQAALEKAEEMAEVMQRASIADTINAATQALEGLSAIQAPALEAITASVAGLNSQFAMFKDGQTSLASAIVGSAGAIAGAVANKVLGVREEAGVRALFETAMGIATAFTNPLESAGHFAAAAAFGAVSLGGFKSTPRGGDGGGNKAPKKEAMATREGALSGGGGQITNVYNLNTGIVDGQSTAHAFRRAEMTARNTGMASAGGW